jgi:hypothetical protein
MWKYLPTIIVALYLLILGPQIAANAGWDLPNDAPGASILKPGVYFIEDISEEFLLPLGRDLILQQGRAYPTLIGWFLSTILVVVWVFFLNVVGITAWRTRHYKTMAIVALYLLICPQLFFIPSIFSLLHLLPFDAPWGGPWGLLGCGNWLCLGEPPSWGGMILVSSITLLLVLLLERSVAKRRNAHYPLH